MKKTFIMIAALTMALVILCSACGGTDTKQEQSPDVSEAQATQLPTVTKPPKEAGEDGVVGANANDTSAAAAHMDRESWLASLSEEQRKVEEELIGATVEELYAAIGEPISAVYGVSCLVANGEDGVLTYDGFTVATTRFPGGQERVMGTSTK